MTRFFHLVGVAHSRCCGLLGLALYELLGPERPESGGQPAALYHFGEPVGSDTRKRKAANG